MTWKMSTSRMLWLLYPDFRKGVTITRTKAYGNKYNSEGIVCWDEKRAEAGHKDSFAAIAPNFVVVRIYRPPGESEQDWQPTDEYLIKRNTTSLKLVGCTVS